MHILSCKYFTSEFRISTKIERLLTNSKLAYVNGVFYNFNKTKKKIQDQEWLFCFFIELEYTWDLSTRGAWVPVKKADFSISLCWKFPRRSLGNIISLVYRANCLKFSESRVRMACDGMVWWVTSHDMRAEHNNSTISRNTRNDQI